MSRYWFLSAILLVIFISATAFHRANSQAENAGVDWQIELKTDKIKSFPSWKSSILKPFVKVGVVYKKTERGKPPLTINNEEFWYSGPDPIGCSVSNTLDFKPIKLVADQAIAVKVSHKKQPASYEEQCAAADALLRVTLDVYVRGSTITNITVPRASFTSMIQQLAANGFQPHAEDQANTEQTGSVISLYIKTDPPGPDQIMTYDPF